MATQLDLPVIERGDTIPYIMHWQDNGNGFDLRGQTLIWTLKLAAVLQDKDATLTKTISIAYTDVDAMNGDVTIVLDHHETAILIPGQTYHYAVRLLVPPVTPTDDPIETTYFYGRVPVKDS